MKIKKITTTLRIDETVLEKLRFMSEKNKRSLNSQIEYVLEQCVENFEKEYGTIPLESE